MAWYLHTKSIRPDGSIDSFITQKVEHKIVPIDDSKYIDKNHIPTKDMIKVDGKWRRVYCKTLDSNYVLYIGKSCDGSACVSEDWE